MQSLCFRLDTDSERQLLIANDTMLVMRGDDIKQIAEKNLKNLGSL